MSQTSNERLKEYLARLPIRSQALLMREFERAIERGEDSAVANLVLEQLRSIVRRDVEDSAPRDGELPRLFFSPLDPFVVDGSFPARPGRIRRSSLLPVWQWIVREGAPEQVSEYEAAIARLPQSGPEVEAAMRKLQTAAAEAIFAIAGPGADDHQRALARVGSPDVIDDLLPIGAALQGIEALERLGSRIPIFIRSFSDSQITSVSEALNVPPLHTPLLLPFAIGLVMHRLAAPWQIIRIATRMAGSDDEVRVAATPYGLAVSLALHDLSYRAGGLRLDIRRGQFADTGENLKALHDGVRGLRTELDLRNDSTWGKQLASIRVDISNTLQSEIDSVPGRVRRILRQRADKDIPSGARIDQSEIEEVASLINFVEVCRTYASELAINEVTLRTYSDMQNYVEQATETLVGVLRGCDNRVRAYRQMQAEASIRFCDVLFGRDYSTLMRKAVENALTAERKPSRAG